jgi:hypothetical protein
LCLPLLIIMLFASANNQLPAPESASALSLCFLAIWHKVQLMPLDRSIASA